MKSLLLLLVVNFVSGVQVGIDVYIADRKYHVKPHSSPWFSAAAIVYRNHFFRLYQQNKSSESKVKFRLASNHCKRILEAAKLAYGTETKESITSQKLGSRNVANSVLSVLKVNLLYLLYSMAQRQHLKFASAVSRCRGFCRVISMFFNICLGKKNAEAIKFLGVLKKYVSKIKKIFFCLKKKRNALFSKKLFLSFT